MGFLMTITDLTLWAAGVLASWAVPVALILLAIGFFS